MKVSVNSAVIKADVDVNVESVKKVGSWAMGKLLIGMNKVQKKMEDASMEADSPKEEVKSDEA
jgi:hypothetical protein